MHRTSASNVLKLGIALAALAAIGCAGTNKGGAAAVGPAAKPSPQVIAMAQNPTPPASATQKTTAGAGKLKISTANATGDTDSFWVASLDIDGDGSIEETQILYDKEDGVLFFYADGAFPCDNGGIGTGEMLMALNCKGNPRGKAVGSGWYAAYLDATECSAQVAGVYGCRFDEHGRVTAFASAVLDAMNDEVVLAGAESR